jgi:hypothetical protein
MGYIDILIPLIAGIVFLMIPDKLIKARDATYEKKKSLLKKCGYLLIGVSILYFVIKTFS